MHDKRGIFRGSLEKYGVAIAVLWYVMMAVNAVLLGRGGGVCVAMAVGNTYVCLLALLKFESWGGDWADGALSYVGCLARFTLRMGLCYRSGGRGFGGRGGI